MGSEQENKESTVAQNQRNYGKIILTLENCLIPEAKLDETPSLIDGLDAETEIDLRILGCELIQTSGILLKLPQVAMATGQVLFQRFFYSKSFVRHSMEATAMSCICLASKIEEAPRRIRDVINVFNHIKQVRSQKPITPVILDQNYINLKSQVIKAERRVLKELGFCVHVKHPHKLIVMYLKYLDFENHQEMMQIAWNFMNDSFRSDVFVRYQPETIACACIFLSARKLNIVLPTIPPWFEIFKVSEDDLIDVCYRICALYRRPKPNAEKLEAAVEELKKKYQEQRKKDRRSENSSPNITIVERTNGSHNAWGGFISRALPTTNNTSSSSSNTAAVPSSGSKSSISKITSNNDYRKSKSKSPRSHSPSPSRSKKGRYRSTSRDRSHSKSKQKRRNSRSSSRSSDSSYEKRSKKRDKKYSKSDDKHFSDRRDRDRHSRKNYSNDGKKDYGHYSYDKDSKYSSKSYGNGHRSRDKRR